MKRIISVVVAVLMAVMNLQVFAQELESEFVTDIKNTVISAWDFSDSAQISGEVGKTDIPVISGGSEYNQENENICLNASSSATGVNLNLSTSITAETIENVINVEFDMNFGSISGQSFSYSIDSTMGTIIDFSFEPYKDSGTGYIRIGGNDVVYDELNGDGTVKTTVNRQIKNCVSSNTGDGMTASSTHFRNEINLVSGEATIYITSGNKSGTFKGTFEGQNDVSSISMSTTKSGSSRHSYMDNLKISQYREKVMPDISELVYSVIQDSDGDVTQVDTSKIVYGDNITSLFVTTSKDSNIVKQYVTDVTDSLTVNTAGADRVEVSPIYTYTDLQDTAFNSEEGVTLDTNALGSIEDGMYSFEITKADGTLTDVYINGKMIINNAEQPGTGRSEPKGGVYNVPDVMITGGTVNVATKRDGYNGTTYPNAPISSITIKKSPEIAARKTKITILGDSLVANYYGDLKGSSEKIGNSRTGWGQVLSEFIDMEKYNVVNLSNSGHYARILYETAFEGAIKNSVPGDIILCQCGYNDRVRSDEAEMVEYMTKMTEEAKEAGVTIVFVTPPATCDDETKYNSGYKNPIDVSADDYVNTSYSYPVRYGKTVYETAQRIGAGIVDLSKYSYDYLVSIYGDDISYAQQPYKEGIGVSDGIHLSYTGAMKWASFVAQELFDNEYIDSLNTETNYTEVQIYGEKEITINCFVSDGEEENPMPTETPNLKPNKIDGKEIYYEDFESGDLTDWKSSSVAYSVVSDDIHGNYLSLSSGSNDRGVYTLFGSDKYKFTEYEYECDVHLKAGNKNSSQFTIMANDYELSSGNINYGVSNGYIVKLNTVNSSSWTINPDTDGKTVDIPSDSWVHIKVSGNEDTVWLEITNGNEVLFDDSVTPYSSSKIPVGVLVRGGKNNAVMDIDNISLNVMKIFDEYEIYKNDSHIGAVIDSGIEGTVYGALYNKDGVLIGMKAVKEDDIERNIEFPLPQEAGASMRIYNWDDNMKPLSQASDMIEVDDIQDIYPDSILKNKSVYAFGDSIVKGHNAPEKAFMNLMANDYEMDLTMYAVNGATVITKDSAKEDPSEVTEGNYILTQVNKASDTLPDIIVFNGGTNDAYGSSDPTSEYYDKEYNSKGDHTNLFDNIGVIQGEGATEFDTNTFCGGFEAIISEMRNKWGDTPIVYITTHKSGGRSWEPQNKVRELALEICREWGVYVVDVFNDSELDTRDPEQMEQYIIGGAGSHPNETACRKFYIPLVKTKLKEILSKTADIIPENIHDTVDVVVFAGQSNMSGRGKASEAVVCDSDAGFEYKSVSNPKTLVPVEEPFGLGEDRDGAIADYNKDGTTKRTGSMVSAVVDEYYNKTGRQIVAVSASIGGTSTEQWKSNYINDAVKRLDDTKSFLTRNGINIGRIFVVWCQGESDGDAKVTAQTYMSKTKELFEIFKSHGVEKCFMVQIGHYNYEDYPGELNGLDGLQWDEQYKVIRDAQTKLCNENDDIVMAGSFENYISDMKDRYHYNQGTYNEVGKTVGLNIANHYEEENI